MTITMYKISFHIVIFAKLEFCDWGYPKNGLCWVWASQDSRKGNPFGEWRAPTEEEWKNRPLKLD